MYHVDANPFIQFGLWFRDACEAMPGKLVNTMSLATVSADNKPSSRIVLLKEYNEHGFIFYTNYQSQKGLNIADNPQVSLLFWWEALERQVRIEGRAEKINVQDSDHYFHTRPKASQIASRISQQSQPLDHVETLQKEYEKTLMQYSAMEAQVPRPTHWGGYIVKPERFEYWQGRENRLHDRFQYNLNAPGQWLISRLFP